MKLLNWKPFPEATHRERRGTLAWIFLAFAALWCSHKWTDWFPKEVPEVAITWLESVADSANHVPQAQNPTLFPFNPNNLPLETWQALGLSRRQAESVHRYEAAGGSFQKPEDVAKLFVVSEALYAHWEPFIDLPPVPKATPTSSTDAPMYMPKRGIQEEKHEVQETPRIHLVDINTADTSALQALPGIGAYTARQIVWHRERLGGFLRLDQLAEVKGMRTKNLTKALPHLHVGPMPERRDLNVVDVEVLGRHPLIRWNQARALVAYRAQHGAYRSWKDVLEVALVSPNDTLEWKTYFHVGDVPMADRP